MERRLEVGEQFPSNRYALARVGFHFLGELSVTENDVSLKCPICMFIYLTCVYLLQYESWPQTIICCCPARSAGHNIYLKKGKCTFVYCFDLAGLAVQEEPWTQQGVEEEICGLE